MNEKGSKCDNINDLKNYLKSLRPKIDRSLPSGQIKYEFSDGLVVNVYTTTNNVTFQGKNIQGRIANKIKAKLKAINQS